MMAPTTDPSPSAAALEPIPLRDPTAGIGRIAARPAWWLDEGEHARVLGVQPGIPKTPKAAAAKFTAKRRVEAPPPTPEQPEAAPAADFAALTPTLAALDRILQPLAADAPGLAPLLRNRRIRRIGRFGAAVGLATLAAAVVFFR